MLILSFYSFLKIPYRVAFTILRVNYVYFSFEVHLVDFLNSKEGKQPLTGDCRNNEDVDSFCCLVEIEEKQLKALLSLLFSLSYSGPFGSSSTAATFKASGNMQLNAEPMQTKKSSTISWTILLSFYLNRGALLGHKYKVKL